MSTIYDPSPPFFVHLVGLAYVRKIYGRICIHRIHTVQRMRSVTYGSTSISLDEDKIIYDEWLQDNQIHS